MAATFKAAKSKGEFFWHHHEYKDELFLVVSGLLRVKFRDREELLWLGEILILPHRMEHLPVAEEETHGLLFEPRATLNSEIL